MKMSNEPTRRVVQVKCLDEDTNFWNSESAEQRDYLYTALTTTSEERILVYFKTKTTIAPGHLLLIEDYRIHDTYDTRAWLIENLSDDQTND
jgi:hypothetical protein